MKFYVEVAVPPLPNLLSYSVEPEIDGADVGSRVVVPLGKRTSQGYIIKKSDSCNFNPAIEDQLSLVETSKVKSIDTKTPPEKCFSENQLIFFKKVAAYYGAPLSSVIDVAIPQSAPLRTKKLLKLLSTDFSSLKKITPKIKSIVELLSANNGYLELSEVNRALKSPKAAIDKMIDAGLLKIDSLAEDQLHQPEAPQWAQRAVELNQDQSKAVETITSASTNNQFKTILLHGVTGSGKTEVYIEAAKKVLAQGKSVIVIVPEIALTPQLIDRFRARLGEDISTLHSGLPKRIRWDSWQRLLDKSSKTAIGARSAIFAPVDDVGLIIVDEEHDGSFKQSEGLRYNARDMAILRAQLSDCPVVLGSATPSLETYYKARSFKYELISLPLRHASSQTLPIEVVDLRTIKPWEMPSPNISPQLLKEIEDAVARKEQVFLLYNRRGFSSFLQCDACGDTVECPQCSVSLTYHQSKNSLLCHYCGVTIQPMEFCPSCVQKEAKDPGKLIQRGSGTERVYDEVVNLFPDLKIDRLDRDTVSSIETYKTILNQVRSGETSILVGTQMIAKGHDLPNVTLVGVVDCDVGIHMPDFRASERAFQLLTQVAGRAGRGQKAGRVILQTRSAGHLAIRKTVEGDFIGFAKTELGQRQKLNYPPFSKLLRIVASGAEQETLSPFLSMVKIELDKYNEQNELKIQILGPSPAPLQKIKGMYRFHLLLKSTTITAINKILHGVCMRLKWPANIKMIFDVDPYEML
jgi:primosomal protein N' (replication factor Y)